MRDAVFARMLAIRLFRDFVCPSIRKMQISGRAPDIATRRQVGKKFFFKFLDNINGFHHINITTGRASIDTKYDWDVDYCDTDYAILPIIIAIIYMTCFSIGTLAEIRVLYDHAGMPKENLNNASLRGRNLDIQN